VTWPSPARRREVSERFYARNPDRFVGAPSPFFAWAKPWIDGLPRPAVLLELGSGPGRDARAIAGSGVEVHAVDHAGSAIARGRAWPDPPAGLEYEEANLFDALARTASGSIAAVYAHAVYMILSDAEVDRLADEVHRVLRPEGLHLFAVRSISDPIAQEGAEVAPDVRQRSLDPEPIRYYRRETVERFTRHGFTRLAGEDVAPAHMWYVCDRRSSV
jgi:SAM-dependent methyltransferase